PRLRFGPSLPPPPLRGAERALTGSAGETPACSFIHQSPASFLPCEHFFFQTAFSGLLDRSPTIRPVWRPPFSWSSVVVNGAAGTLLALLADRVSRPDPTRLASSSATGGPPDYRCPIIPG